jgi:hypothetical protein
VLTTKDGTLIHFKGQPVVFSHRWFPTADACSIKADRQGITVGAR